MSPATYGGRGGNAGTLGAIQQGEVKAHTSTAESLRFNFYQQRVLQSYDFGAQVEAAYAAFKAKYFSVTLGAIRSELTSNTAFSDVLALEPWRVGSWDGSSDSFCRPWRPVALV